MKIALFGAAFDPPHLAHLMIAQNLIKNQIVDQVWLLPVRQHAFAKQMTAAPQRLAMLQLLLKDPAMDQTLAPQIIISDYELKKPEVSYSYATLEELSKKYPQHRFSWVIGSDNLSQFHRWHHYQELMAKYPVYVYPRTGFSLEAIYPQMIALRDLPMSAISSTAVRDKVKKNQAIRALVGQAIEEYIDKHQLYQ